MPKLKKQSRDQVTKKKIELVNKKRNASNYSSLKVLDIVNNDIDNNSENIIEFEDQKNLPKIIVGDFSQFTKEFPQPHHQCTAMATVALATASFKSVVSWNSNDVNSIIRAGQIYYENCISYQNVVNSE